MKKLGIVVPFRNRWEHYYVFLYCIEKYLKSKGIDYSVIVVEQDNSGAFNRGMLCNIGFLQAKKLKCDYVVFHDVDMIPEDIDYSYSSTPIHLATSDLPFESYFGGMTLFPVELFEKINGFSNKYWGWGFEDDDLRYRCIKNGVKFEKDLNSDKESDLKTVKFNGYDSYIEVENHLQTVRSFKIEIQARLDSFSYDFEKTEDAFNLLELKTKNTFNIQYTSYKRFVVQFFDSKGKFYQLYTRPVGTNSNNLIVEYIAETKEVTFVHNGDEVGRVKLEYRLENHSNAKSIYIGCNSELKNIYKGSIDVLNIINSYGEYEYKYEGGKIQDYKWKDLSGNKRNARLVNIAHAPFKSPVNYDGYVPFRREGLIDRLPHSENGYNNGRWKDDLTRWNQLRYNNEVLGSNIDTNTEGLNTCEYAIHSNTEQKNTSHLVVGIS